MWGLPIVASAHGHEIDTLILLLHILALVLFVGWGIFFIVVMVRFRKSVNPKANYHGVQGHVSSVIEWAVVVAEVVLLFGFSVPFWAKQVNALPNRPDKLELRVIAEQFAWNIHYPGKDGIFGKTAPKLVDQQNNPIGLDMTDPNAKDDVVTLNQLHIPVGRTVLIHLTSKDVIHCFGINVMRVKQDTIPGLSIPVWFTPTKTGKFDINCAQLCGIGHYKMRGFLTVHSSEDFDKWMSEQATMGGDSEDSGDSFWN